MVIVNKLIENDKLHRKQEVRVIRHSQLTFLCVEWTSLPGSLERTQSYLHISSVSLLNRGICKNASLHVRVGFTARCLGCRLAHCIIIRTSPGHFLHH